MGNEVEHLFAENGKESTKFLWQGSPKEAVTLAVIDESDLKDVLC